MKDEGLTETVSDMTKNVIQPASDTHTASESTPRIMTGLASVPPGTILNESALAQMLQVTDRTVRRMVQRHELPPPIPFAGRSTWIAGKVLAFIEEKADKAAKDAERRAVARERVMEKR